MMPYYLYGKRLKDDMDFNNMHDLMEKGFTGFVSVKDLWVDRSVIPKLRGIYLVLNPDHKNTEFINPGTGGFFKGKDPNVAIEVLKENYVRDSLVVYIGKAGSLTGKATLHSRLGQYLKFGQGKNIGHWGGRFIWQLKNHADLIYCWKETQDTDPRNVEKQLLSDFIDQFGVRPFANLTG